MPLTSSTGLAPAIHERRREPPSRDEFPVEWIISETGLTAQIAGCTETENWSSVLFMASFILLLVAGLVAGAMNAAAGGGSFVTLPAMIFAGLPSVDANVSSTVALFPGAVASVVAYRDDFRPFELVSLRVLLMVSLCGRARRSALACC